eukprot:15476187-Alexandrium_andersonii.AAC.1
MMLAATPRAAPAQPRAAKARLSQLVVPEAGDASRELVTPQAGDGASPSPPATCGLPSTGAQRAAALT